MPVQIFRLSGIYSNEKNVLTRLKSGETQIIYKKKQFFSRIHVEDIANILFKSLDNFIADNPGTIFREEAYITGGLTQYQYCKTKSG